MESTDPHAGGVLVVFDSGVAKLVAWRSEAVVPALDTAKGLAAQVLEALQRDGKWDEIRDTNWVSVTAAMNKLVRDWNGALVARQGAARGQAH